MKTRSFVLILLLVLLMFGTQPASAELADEDVTDAIEIIRLINEYRVGLGLWPYTFDQTLALTAQGHSEYQALNNISTHKGEGGTTSTDRARAQGYSNASFFRTDEMIYNGSFATPQKAFDWWKGSPIHNGIMTSDVYHEIGVGIAHSAEGRIYYTVNVGMIPNVTSRGASSYTAPSVDEYKVSSIPVEVSPPGADGSIYHTYKNGETLAAIATAYEISLDDLLRLNTFAADELPADGDILLIRLPVEQEVPTPTPTSPPPSPTPEPTATEEPDNTAVPDEDEPPIQATDGGPGGADAAPQANDLIWLWILLAVLAIAGAGVGVFWYLPRLRTTVQEEGFDLEAWLMDDLRDKEEKQDWDHEEFQSTTEEFDHLERPQQIRLLEQAARRALAAYPLQVESLELLRYVLNAEFVVQARPENSSDALKRYVLRVNAPGFHTRAEIASELIWLDALTNDTKLIVPVPVRTRTGGWVETVDHPALGIFRHCVLFEYLPASASDVDITPRRMEFLGALIALLHRHGAAFKPPRGFTRKHWDLEGMRGEMLDVPATQALAALEDDERRVLREAEKIVAEAMNELGTGPEVYGLIHGDLHLKSMLFTDDNRPVVIDFDTCGWGYYIYDLAVAVWNIFNRDDFTALRDALLRGYRKVRPLSRMEETLMIHFVAGRLMVQILTWAPRRAHSPLRETADKAIDRQISQLKALLRILNE